MAWRLPGIYASLDLNELVVSTWLEQSNVNNRTGIRNLMEIARRVMKEV